MQRTHGYIRSICKWLCSCFQTEQAHNLNNNNPSLPLIPHSTIELQPLPKQQSHSPILNQKLSHKKNRINSSDNLHDIGKNVKVQPDHVLQRTKTDQNLTRKISFTSNESPSKLLKGRQSFHTVNSFSSRPSMRGFKVLQRISSLSKNSLIKSINSNEYQEYKPALSCKQQNFYQEKLNANDDKQKLIQSIMQQVNEQYVNDDTSKQIIIDASTKIQIQNNNIINTLINKLEDYYTFYYDLTDLLPSSSSTFIYKNNQFYCSYTKQQQTISSNHIYMSICTFRLAVPFRKFIKWFNKLQIQSIFHNFHQITNRSNKQELNILNIVQFSPKMKLNGKTTYQMIRVMDFVQFQVSQNDYFLQIDFTFNKFSKTFQRIIRIQACEKGLVEIYTQSQENIRGDQSQYFLTQWKQFQIKVLKDKISIF